jgi:hypothetical protein
MCRIGGRLGNLNASWDGAIVEIPLFLVLGSNLYNRDSAWWVV